MLVDTVAQLEVLVEHGSQRERDRLDILSVAYFGFVGRSPTLSIIYDVGGVSFGSLKCDETDGVSRSLKQMPPRAVLEQSMSAGTNH